MSLSDVPRSVNSRSEGLTLDVAGTPHEVKPDTGVIAVTSDGQLYHLSLKFDSAGHCWRLTRPGNSQTSLVYKIGGLAGRPRRTRCTCVDALLTRVDDEHEGDDDCGHIAAIKTAGLLTVLDLSVHRPMPIRGGAPEPELGPTEQDWADLARDRELEDLRDTVRALRNEVGVR